MSVSRNRRNTHASRALALRRSTARAETAARRRLSADSSPGRSVDAKPVDARRVDARRVDARPVGTRPAGATRPAVVAPAHAPAAEPAERLHTVVVKVPAGERRSFSDAVRAVLVRCAGAREAAAAITGGTGARALEALPGKVAPLAVLPGRVPVLDRRSVLGADVDSERWVFCPRCATRARFRGRAGRLPDPGGVWIGDPEAVDVVVVACRLCSPVR